MIGPASPRLARCDAWPRAELVALHRGFDQLNDELLPRTALRQVRCGTAGSDPIEPYRDRTADPESGRPFTGAEGSLSAHGGYSADCFCSARADVPPSEFHWSDGFLDA